MLLQSAEKGSYRTDDVLTFLDWALPAALTPQDSCIVLLDWYAAHLSEPVAELMRNKGHVLLHHGGGTTGLEQVNDTHLHASLQRRVEETEVQITYEQRRRDPDRTPKLSRQDIVDLVKCVWSGIDHAGVAAKGYEQTGPLLPMSGEKDGQLFRDLLPWWEKMDGPKIREEAVAKVQQLWDDGIVTGWNDVESLIDQHDPHPMLEEGQEHVPFDIVDDEAGLAAEAEDDEDGEEAGGAAEEPLVGNADGVTGGGSSGHAPARRGIFS